MQIPGHRFGRMGDREPAVWATGLSNRNASKGEEKIVGPAAPDAVGAWPSAWEFHKPIHSLLSTWREVGFHFPTCQYPGQDA